MTLICHNVPSTISERFVERHGPRLWQRLANELRAAGVDIQEASLSADDVVVRIGLNFAPHAGTAFAVVMQATSEAALEWASSLEDPDADLGCGFASNGTTIH